MRNKYSNITPKSNWKRSLCISGMLLMTCPWVAGAHENQPSKTEVEALLQQAKDKTSKLVGVVTDSKTGEPLIGVKVQIKGTKTGAITDIDGKFEIKANEKDVLVVSFIGYTNKEVRVGKQKVLSITLSEDTHALGEVVVTAFGTGQKKETLTGAIQTIRPSDLKVPAANLSTAFAGRIAGVIAYQRSGEPGSNGANFYIRGIATMSGATHPLIILDGVEISQADLNALDPEVIDSFSILKDATASAMYGTRGANGVLIIKTKSGADLDRPVITVRIEDYINIPLNSPKIADPERYMRLYNEALKSDKSGKLPYSEEFIQGVIHRKDPYLYPNVDWHKELFKNYTNNQRANMSIRGGTAKITYFLNMNVTHEEGMLRSRSKDFFSFDNNINYMKYAFQNNVDFHLSKTSKLALHLNAQFNSFHGPITASNGNGGIQDIFSSIMGVNAVDFPITYPKGDSRWIRWGIIQPVGNYVPSNPMAVATSGYKDFFESTVVVNLDYDQKLDFITKGLSFKSLISFKNWSRSTKWRHQGFNTYYLDGNKKNDDGSYPIKASSGNPTKPNLGAFGSTAGDRSYYLQAYLNYDRTFGNHHVSAMALFNQDEFNNNINGTDLIASLPKRRMGFAGRLSYDYAHRYLIEFNAGYNGSENFAKGHRFGFFPSAAIGWNVSQESFWKPLSGIISNLKLRASYGLVGNDNIGAARFAYLPIVSYPGGPTFKTGFGETTVEHRGATFSRVPNPNLSWEIGKKLNLGVDLKLLDMLGITLDIFREDRTNIFQQKQTIPNSFGTAQTVIYGNYAAVRNQGLDFAVDFNKSFSKDFSLSVNGTFTYAKNRVMEYDEAPNLRPALRTVGASLNTYLGYVADGLFIDAADIDHSPKSTIGNIPIAPGDIKYIDQPDKDGNYDGRIDADDRVRIGYPTVPEIIYGFNARAKYKNFDLGVFFQGQSHVSLMMSGFHPFGHSARRSVLSWVADNHWSPDNQNINAIYPRLTIEDNNNNTTTSTHWLRDASFLKLKNVELGYTYKFARIYINASNLLTISPFKYWDPEMGGGSGMAYPHQRTFNVGLQLTFK